MAKHKKIKNKYTKDYKYTHSAYLERLGMSNTDARCGFKLTDDDWPRFKNKIKKQYEKYGFDYRETWCLDFSLCIYINTRLKMLKETATAIEWSFQKYSVDGVEKSVSDWIDECISLTDNYLVYFDDDPTPIEDPDIAIYNQVIDDYSRVFRILAVIHKHLWW